MKRIRIILLLIILQIAFALAAGPQIEWQKSYGGSGWDWGTSIDEASDGGFIMAILTYSYSSSSDILLVRTNSKGDTLWTKRFDDAINTMIGMSVQQTSDGGFIVFGNVNGNSLNDGLVIKTDADGDTLWTYRYDYSGEQLGRAVRETKDGSYIFAGKSQVHPPGYHWGDPLYYNAWLMKLNADGDTLWNKKYGWAGDDEANWIEETSCKPGAPLFGDSDYWLFKTDTNGDTVWSATFGGDGNDIGYSVAETTDGYVIAGHTNSFGVGNNDGWIVKTDAVGNELWNKTYGGPDDDLFFDIQPIRDGGFLLSGRTGMPSSGIFDVWIVKINSAGDTVWTQTLGGEGFDGVSKAVVTSDNGYAIAAQSEYYNTNGSSDAWLIRFESDPTEISDESILQKADSFQLLDNYPNPFNPVTNIPFTIGANTYSPSSVRLSIYNTLGQEVAVLVNGIKEPGNYTVQWNAASFPSGVYYCKLTAGGQNQNRKMLLVK